MTGTSWDVVIVGGGLAGLTAAHRLRQGGCRTLLLEAGSRVGGAVRTVRREGWTYELGPNTVMARGPLDDLIDELGLRPQVVTADPAARRRYIVKAGRLEPLPRGPLGLLRSRVFGWRDRFRLLREPWLPPRRDLADRDESVAAFTRRRLGDNWLDYAVGPFVSGIYAGDAERLSMRWTLPTVTALERDHGSLLRGAMARRKQGGGRGTMLTFEQGLQTLPMALARQVGEVRCDATVESVSRLDGTFRVAGSGFEVAADRVLLALGARPTAQILHSLPPASSAIAAVLSEVPHASLAVVSLGFRREQVRHAVDGFGFLAPRCESLRLLGCLFPSTIFPGRVPHDHVLLSAFVGGRLDAEAVEGSDESLVELVYRELDALLGLEGEPVQTQLARWRPAIPQYELGHERFAEAIDQLTASQPGLYCVGSYLGGASVPATVAKGEEVARRMLESGCGRINP